MSKLIFLQDVDFKASPMVRSSLREDVIEDYAAIYKSGKNKLPPLEVFTEDGKHFLLADGMHRAHALMKLKQKTATANVTKGTYEDALKFALLANDRHGLRRSIQDKRRCVERAIAQWPKISNNQIAGLCNVDDHTVKAVRDVLEKEGKVNREPVRDTADGRTQRAERPKPATSEIRSETKNNAIKDNTGYEIPTRALNYWNRTPEIKELIRAISGVQKVLRRAQEREDRMYVEVNFTGVQADLEKVVHNIACAIPHAVCPTCGGQPQAQPNGQCRLCLGRGLVSRFRWDKLVPSEVKNMRKAK